MEFVYLLTNVHVPELVKFGFSTRDPHDRATELSSPTGVPGRWKVHHYWEVEDGFAVEQAIFKRLSSHRLERQEFFRLPADDAVRIISQALKIVGTNPLEKARREAEAAAQNRRAATELRAKEREKKLAMRRELEERKAAVLRQLKEEQAPIEQAMTKSDVTAYKLVTAAVFALAFLANEEKGMVIALASGVGWVVMCYAFPIIPMSIGLMKDNSKYRNQLAEVESRVLAAHGFRSREELDVPAELLWYR
ncbi:MAG: GIY-YIG nuclease family protein [Rhodocyclaceae bacterium]|jgi:hypothetical protein|nr:GIY-YIG nuclease family protein [Rhodocyclaceae bacterium]MCA3021449.1 GIY-YIG nuclease family protein [Rhodocyclaceae bacterium]MCA3028399.1 GIY-YIG nuclease family protein [Rhodocyclaceae bacterium]MCA3044002.1 GIY-YIG nuclease family protein [Rhodocyclaceae bacterium]MCA3054197.1 GIY-YIG nuclease family protein [Rhodocyclaceae bacterium]